MKFLVCDSTLRTLLLSSNGINMIYFPENMKLRMENKKFYLAVSNFKIALRTFSSPETVLLLVSTKNRDLWPGLTLEVHDSQTSCHSAHAQSQV